MEEATNISITINKCIGESSPVYLYCSKSVIMSIQNLVKSCPFIIKIWSKNKSLTSIKGRNSSCKFAKTKIYNTNVDLVNDNVYAKFGLNLSIRSQDIEPKPNSDVSQGP